MTLCYTPEKVSFLFLDDLGNISTLLDKDYDFEKKNTINQGLNILKTCTVYGLNLLSITGF